MAIVELKLIVRQNSTISKQNLITIAKDWANDREHKESENSFYINVFDSRDTKSYYVFSDGATKTYEIANSLYDIQGVVYLSSVIDDVAILKKDDKRVEVV